MSAGFVLGRENVPCVAEVVNRSLKADCTDFIYILAVDTFDDVDTLLMLLSFGHVLRKLCESA